MSRHLMMHATALLVWFAPVWAQTDSFSPAESAAPEVTSPADESPLDLDAYDAVRQGNQLLRNGAPAAALRHYKHAESLKPDAREIAFGEGLGHFQLGEYEAAREAFQRAWLGEKDALADDALYSEGAAYHAEALAAMSEPEAALERLENAMQRYQSVLSNHPEHEAARDANYKAGAAWRQIKQQMQQQQQQQQDQNNDEKNDDEQQQQDQQSQDQENQDEKKEQQEQQQQQSQKDQQSEQQEQNSESQQDENSSESKPQEQEEQASEAQKQQEEVSREQAERKLREMMQAQRQRQKDRKKQRVVVPVPAGKKDW